MATYAYNSRLPPLMQETIARFRRAPRLTSLATPRFADVTTVPDTGRGTSPIVDMGAYEVSILPSASLAAASQNASESAGTVGVLVQLSAASSLPVTIPFTLSGTATQNTDYTIASTSLTIPAGSTTGTATFQITNDALYEPDETIILTIGTTHQRRARQHHHPHHHRSWITIRLPPRTPSSTTPAPPA